jgi:MFS family permease
MTQGNSHGAVGVTPGTVDASAYAPLRHPVFRALWIASLATNLGTWLQNVAAGWLMTGLTPSPLMAALVQAATTLPVFLLALPAGALADVIDRACCSPPMRGCARPRRRSPRSRPPAS